MASNCSFFMTRPHHHYHHHHHHLGGGCSSARCVSDSSSICRPVLCPPSGLGDGGVEAFRNVLAPSSSWSASPPLSFNNALIYTFLQTLMPFDVSKVLHFAFHNGIEQPVFINVPHLLQDGCVCPFFGPRDSENFPKTFHLKRIYSLFGLLTEAPCF